MVALLKPETKIQAVTALQVSQGLDDIVNSGRVPSARALKSFMRESLAAASVQGWRTENDNPVRDVKIERVVVKRARLSWDFSAGSTRTAAAYGFAMQWNWRS